MHYAVPLIGPEVHPIETGDDPVRVLRKRLSALEQSSLRRSLATGLHLQKCRDEKTNQETGEREADSDES